MNQLQNTQEVPATEAVYAQLDKTAADFLRVRERNIRQAMDNAATEVGRELKKAQDMLAGRNQYNGFFEKWYTAMGFKKQTVYNLIHRYIFIHEIDDEQRRQLIEALPLSLTYEISKPTANEKAVQAVLNGDIKTTKAYRELVKRLEEEKKAREEAEQRAKEAEQYAKEKEKEAEKSNEYKAKLQKAQEEIKEYEQHIVQLHDELEKFKLSMEYDTISPQAREFLERQLEIVEDCNNLAEKLVVLGLNVPKDLPEITRVVYKEALDKLATVCLQFSKALDREVKTIDPNVIDVEYSTVQ